MPTPTPGSASITRTVIQCFSGLFLYKGQPQLPLEKQIFSELKSGAAGLGLQIMILFFITEILIDPMVGDEKCLLSGQSERFRIIIKLVERRRGEG